MVDFVVNQKQIEKELCINKSKPELNCHGKCELNKRLDNIEKINSNSEKTSEKISLRTLLKQEYTNQQYKFSCPIKECSILKYKKEKLFFCENFYSFQFIFSVFHPPKFA